MAVARRNDMRRFVKAVIPMAVTAVVTHIVLFMVLGDILLTVAFGMVGEKWAMIPYTLFFFAAQVGAVLIVWRVRKPRDAEARREYLNLLGGEVYSRKADRKAVSRDKSYRAELVAYAVVACVQFFMQFSVGAIIYAPLAYLIFHIYNRRLWLNLHETWADERIRLNPEA